MSVKPLFKIYFNKLSNDLDEDYHLTFQSLQSLNLSYSQFPSFLRQFNEQSRKKTTFSVQKLRNIIEYESNCLGSIVQSFIILFTEQKQTEMLRKGFFIGKNKGNIYHIMGYWPFSREEMINAQPAIVSRELEQLISKPDKFSEVILITE